MPQGNYVNAYAIHIEIKFKSFPVKYNFLY